MSTVGVRELQNRLTHYRCRSKQGAEVVGTERGKPIALLQPIQAADPVVSLHARLARLAARGLVALPTQTPRRHVQVSKARGTPISTTILHARR